ncbi:MAG TPA: hypothetical protein VFF28_02810 [Candidatus Nanoarchaeia archaeon]|nr:hypothetical protein [Candidatus Nanoarchaeia archaeon]
MGLEEVKNEILEKSKAEIKKIESHKERELNLIAENTEKSIAQRQKRLDEEIEHKIEAMKQRNKAEMIAEKRDLLLRIKNEQIEKAMAEAKKKLKKQEEKYVQLLLEKAKKQISVGKVYAKHEIPGIKTEIKDIDGVIVESKDGKFLLDYSFATILAGIKEKRLKEISEAL